MKKNPYINLPSKSFWKKGVLQESPTEIKDIYSEKFKITKETNIAAAGSCFAQHITRHLKKNGYNVIDEEPAPKALPKEDHQKYGYSLYSARYGNIYTVRQLLQLAEEVFGTRKPNDHIFEKNGRFYDALRPSIHPEGFPSREDLEESRSNHIESVKKVFKKLDLLIFTLGLTEMWVNRKSGTVYPSAPGVIAGEFDPEMYKFENAYFNGIINDFKMFQDTMLKIRDNRPFNILLTVSPVPLAATASGNHVLVSNTHSKSILRAVAGQLCNLGNIDYFPSYEIVTNPKLASSGFDKDLRSVKNETVEIVMNHFFKDFVKCNSSKNVHALDSEEVLCEDQLLEEFNKFSSDDEPTKFCEEIEVDYEYESIESFLSTKSIQTGVYSIKNFITVGNNINELPLIFKIIGNLKSGTVVSHFHGAVDRKKNTLPFIWGLNSESTREKSIQIFFSDPLLFANNDINLCWYALSYHDIAKVISHIEICTKAKNSLLVGGSGGGLPALNIYSILKKASVLIWNPQMNILKFHKNHIDAFLSIFNLSSTSKNLINELEKKNIKHNFEYDDKANESCSGKIYIFQEKADSFHIDNHLKPFLKSRSRDQNIGDLKSMWINEKIYLHMGDWRRSDKDPEHMVPPMNLLFDCMNVLIENKCPVTLNLDKYNFKRN